jgi:peptide deformylase
MHHILPANKNPALRHIARAIPASDIAGDRIQTLIKEMKKLLGKEEYGVALAASQVGEALRLFVVSGAALKRREKKYHDSKESADGTAIEDAVYINPTLLKTSRAKTAKHEGCLSIRGKWGVVPRAEKVTIHAWDEHGRELTRGASGLLAHIFQHEMDHLEGILYIDKATEIYDDQPDEE